MVDRMLDLVSAELETGDGFVDSTFFEPAAGDGNFLTAVLRRKLNAIEQRYPREEWPLASLRAVASVYGVELLEDNHQEAQTKMLSVFTGFLRGHGIRCGSNTNLFRAAAFLVGTNIACGNTLTGKTHKGEEIVLSWWDRVDGQPGMVQRRPFTLASLMHDGFDFTDYETFAPCMISKVHMEARIDA